MAIESVPLGSCRCTGKCDSMRCGCVKDNRICSLRCHKGSDHTRCVNNALARGSEGAFNVAVFSCRRRGPL
ncbi:hypothetical protein BDZ91DRAFT_150339 [Kalaharituber pfeilii]|nr:hypothetical protein BDZ91DRAFT_150339 [Kalaharituber pfeilii]